MVQLLYPYEVHIGDRLAPAEDYPLLVHTFTKWSYFHPYLCTYVYYHCYCYGCCYREVSGLGRCEMKFRKARCSGPEALRVMQLGINV